MNTPISKRELEVLQLISYEYSTKEIATHLCIGYETAHSHRKNLFKKLKVRNAAGLVRRAFEIGLLNIEYSEQKLKVGLRPSVLTKR